MNITENLSNISYLKKSKKQKQKQKQKKQTKTKSMVKQKK